MTCLEITADVITPSSFPDASRSYQSDVVSLHEELIRPLNYIKNPSRKLPFALLHYLKILPDRASFIHYQDEQVNETVRAEEIYRKIEQLKALEEITGMLNELSESQIKIFEEAVKRRPLFK